MHNLWENLWIDTEWKVNKKHGTRKAEVIHVYRTADPQHIPEYTHSTPQKYALSLAVNQ